MAEFSDAIEELCDLMDFLTFEDLPSPDELRSDMAPKLPEARGADKKTDGTIPSSTCTAQPVQVASSGISAGPTKRPLRVKNRRPCAASKDLRDVLNARRSRGNDGHNIADLRDILRIKRNLKIRNQRNIAYGRNRGVENIRSCDAPQDLRDVLTARRRGRNGPCKSRRQGRRYAPW